MVIHLVHKNNEGELAVVGVYYNSGDENNAVKTIWENLPEKEGEEKSLAGIKINPEEVLPAARSYYSYTGSLTTPPCTEGVNWFILENQPTVSKAQVNKFISIFPKSTRPVQPLNNRKITHSSI